MYQSQISFVFQQCEIINILKSGQPYIYLPQSITLLFLLMSRPVQYCCPYLLCCVYFRLAVLVVPIPWYYSFPNDLLCLFLMYVVFFILPLYDIVLLCALVYHLLFYFFLICDVLLASLSKYLSFFQSSIRVLKNDV